MISTLKPENHTTGDWVSVDWEDFLQLAEQSQDEQSRLYYDRGLMRVDMSPIGSAHSQDDPVISKVVSLYATFKNIRIKEIGNGSFRKTGWQECQPDIAFYIGSEFRFPARTNAPIDVGEYGVPDLVIEIAATSLNDDLGRKRLLYERLGVREYWVVDVSASETIAFEGLDGGSRQIQESKVLPGLKIATVEQALKRSQTEEDGAINRWLLQIFSASVEQQ